MNYILKVFPELKLLHSFYKTSLTKLTPSIPVLLTTMSSFHPRSINNSISHIWFSAHLITVLGAFTYIFGYNPSNLYTIMSLSCCITYLVILIRHSNHPRAMFRSDNSQLFFAAMLALTSRRLMIKLVPFSVYSILNVCYTLAAEYFPHYSMAQVLLPVMNHLEPPLLTVASYVELALCLIYGLENGFRPFPGLMYVTIMFNRMDTSETLRKSIITAMAAVGGSTQIAPARAKPERVASLNLDTLEIVNDL